MRNYKREYKLYHGLPQQKKNRAMRGRARYKMGLKVGDPRQVDHKKPINQGGGNGRGNLRAVSKSMNLGRKRK